MVRGDNDFEKKDSNLTKVHQVVVKGRPGDTVNFTIGSMAGPDAKAREQVTVHF